MKEIYENNRVIFVMMHPASIEQLKACEGASCISQVEDKSLLIVPDDPELSRDWFVQRATEIENSFLGFSDEDIIHVMGQQQLAMAVIALGRKAGSTIVESVTPRKSVEKTLPNGTVEKTNIFTFSGFRTVHSY